MKSRKIATYRSFRLWLAKEYHIASLKIPSRQSILSIKHMDIPQEEYVEFVKNFTEKSKEFIALLRKVFNHKISSKEVALQRKLLILSFQKEEREST